MTWSRESEIFLKILEKAIGEINCLAERIRSCARCSFRKVCEQPLPGAGYPLADIMFVKGAPTKVEDSEGVAFFGRVGEALFKAFDRLNMDITDVYGTNAVKCFLPDVQSVSIEHVEACKEYLKTEIEILGPKVIVAMGPLAFTFLKSISLEEYEDPFSPGRVVRLRPDIQVLMTHEPELALKNPQAKREFWRDLKRLRQILGK